MEAIKENNLQAMISLLDDPDELTYKRVKGSLLKAGEEIIPFLQTGYHKSKSSLQKQRLKLLISIFKLKKLRKELRSWKDTNSDDLLEGVLIIARYAYHVLDDTFVKNTIDAIERDVASMMENKKEADAVDILNEVILRKYGFAGNTEDYTGVQNSYINKVIETRMGNPIMLCVLYLLVARRLSIPLIGINSPRHFILAFIGNKEKGDRHSGSEMDNVSFFVDPFYKGITYSSPEYITMLQSTEFYRIYKDALPASNIAIIKRVLHNVIYAIQQEGKKNRANNLLRIAYSL